MLSGRAIYSSSSSLTLYVGLLAAAKFLRAVGLFLAYDLLKLIPVVQFLFIIKAGTAIPLLFLQKPFSSGRKLTKNQLFRIGRHAVVGSLIYFLWLFGLTLCGPLRTILLFEHSDIVIIAGFSALFTNAGGGPAKEFTKFQRTMDDNLNKSVASLKKELMVSHEALLPKAKYHKLPETATSSSEYSHEDSGSLMEQVSVPGISLVQSEENAYKSPKEDVYSIDLKPLQSRGAVFFLVAVITLLLFDHDEKLDMMSEHDANHADIHGTFISHFFYHIVNLVGWSDHKGGVVLLFMTLCLHVGYNTAAKKLSVEVGGSKRLHALSTLVSACILWPWAAFTYLTRESDIQSWLYLLFPLLLVILFVFLIDFYIEAVALNHLQPPKTALFGVAAISIGALFLSATWDHPYMAQITTMHKLREVITEDHVLSGGVVFSLMVLLLGSWLLVSPSRSAKGSFIGYSPSGLPLYSFTGEALHRTSQSVFIILKNGLRQILEDSNSRKIFYFLCVNLMFTFVELLYGVWTNSLGLISDGFHMLFDCSALVMGLYAAIMSRWKATRIFSYGYDRVEVLSGFINGLFLVIIAIFVFAAAVTRLFDPPEIKTERLLTVSVMGLAVNLIGIFAFSSSHGHSHGGGGHGHSHGGGHGHSHGGHGHSHGGHGHSHGGSSQCEQSHSLWGDHGHGSPAHSSHGHSHFGHNTNMQGVFLHVLADTMGSVGVIISTLFIENFGWNIADPICSLFIATMILLSVLPLLKETTVVLLLRSPKDMEKDLTHCLQKILSIEGVLSYRRPHFWWHTSSKVVGMVHVQVAPDKSEQKIIAQVTTVFREIGITNLTVQVEKESFFQHLSGLGASFDQVIDATYNLQQLTFNEPFTVKSI